MLLDDFLPEIQFNEVHTVHVNAPPEKVFTAIKELTASELSPLIFWMLNLRELPGRLLGKTKPGNFHAGPFLDQLYEEGFIPLGELPSKELVFGLIGQFWKLAGDDELPTPVTTPEDFLSFANPEYAKVAANLIVTKIDGSEKTLCSTETRVYLPNQKTRKKFAFYWRIISMGSGWIRVLWLRAIKHKAEAAI